MPAPDFIFLSYNFYTLKYINLTRTFSSYLAKVWLHCFPNGSAMDGLPAVSCPELNHSSFDLGLARRGGFCFFSNRKHIESGHCAVAHQYNAGMPLADCPGALHSGREAKSPYPIPSLTASPLRAVSDTQSVHLLSPNYVPSGCLDSNASQRVPKYKLEKKI